MLEGERWDLQPERHLQIVARDDRIEHLKRAAQLRLDARVEVARRASGVEDPLGGKVVENCRAVRQPVPMSAEAADDAVASPTDLATQLDELRCEIRVLRHMPRRPALTRIGIVVDDRLALAWDLR